MIRRPASAAGKVTNKHRIPVKMHELPDGRQLEKSQLYSEELGIDLGRHSDAEYFRWFLASILFGGRISEAIARNTYRAFVRHGLTTPRKI
jgi:hypothetical protein